MLRMINLEMDQIEEIQREFNGGAINIEDIANRLTTMNICVENSWQPPIKSSENWHFYERVNFRLDEEDRELEELSYDDLQATTTTETYYPGLPLLAG